MEFYENKQQQPISQGAPHNESPHEIQHIATPIYPVLPYLGIGTSSLVAGLQHNQLVEALNNPDWPVRVAAIRALEKHSQSTPINALIVCLTDTHQAVRVAAARALGASGTETPIAALTEALYDSDWHVRSTAAMALGKQKNRAPVAPLVTLLQDEDASVRAAAAWAIGELDERAPTPPLVAALQDTEASVREAALLALAGLGSRAPLGPLLAIRNDPDSRVQEVLETALQQTHPEFFTAQERIAETLAFQPGQNITINTARPEIASIATIHPGTTRKENGPTRPSSPLPKRFFQPKSDKTQKPKTTNRKLLTRITEVIERGLVAAAIIGMCLSWLMLGYRLHPTGGSSPYISTWFSYHSPEGAITKVLWGPRDGIHSMAFIAFSDANGCIEVWNISKKQYSTTYCAPGHGTALSFIWTANGLQMAFSNGQGTISLVRVNNNNRPFMQLATPPGAIPTAAWSSDGRRIAIASNAPEDHFIHVWDTTTHSEIAIHQSHNSNISSIVWSPDGKTIASTDGSGQTMQIEVWDADTGQSILSNNPTRAWIEPFKVLAVSWSPDGQRIAYILSNGEVHLRDSRTDTDSLLTPENTMQTGTKSAWNAALTWSPDSQKLASSDPSGMIQIWDTNSGKPLSTFNGHRHAINDMAWSPDEKQVVSASTDGALFVWESI